MLKPEIEAALNRQMNQEFGAAHEYTAMSVYFRQRAFGGFASFMMKQATEEREHAHKFLGYIDDRGGSVVLDAIPAPATGFTSAKSVFAAATAREHANSVAIHDLYRLAAQHDDPATRTMLDWFIQEQVEEEAWCAEAMELLDMAGDDAAALLALDQRYGAAD